MPFQYRLYNHYLNANLRIILRPITSMALIPFMLKGLYIRKLALFLCHTIFSFQTHIGQKNVLKNNDRKNNRELITFRF